MTDIKLGDCYVSKYDRNYFIIRIADDDIHAYYIDVPSTSWRPSSDCVCCFTKLGFESSIRTGFLKLVARIT